MVVITEGPGPPAWARSRIWDTTHDGEAIHEASWMVLPAHQGRGSRAALALLVDESGTSSDLRHPRLPARDQTPSNALCRKAGFALLGETIVEFAGRPLRCDRWALALAGPGQLNAGFAGNGQKAIGFGSVDAARAVLVQPDGRIVLAAAAGPRAASRSRGCAAAAGSTRRLRRRRRTLGFGSEQEAPSPPHCGPTAGSCSRRPDLRVAVARLRPDGALDTSFSSNSRKMFSWGPISRATAVLVLRRQTVLAGFAGPEGGDVSWPASTPAARWTRPSATTASRRSTSGRRLRAGPRPAARRR